MALLWLTLTKFGDEREKLELAMIKVSPLKISGDHYPNGLD